MFIKTRESIPVSLIVFDGTNKEVFTQHITVNGEPFEKAGLYAVV